MFLIEFQSTLKNKQSCYNYRKNIFINLKSLSRNIQNMSISWCSRCVFSRYIYIYIFREVQKPSFFPEKKSPFRWEAKSFFAPPNLHRSQSWKNLRSFIGRREPKKMCERMEQCIKGCIKGGMGMGMVIPWVYKPLLLGWEDILTKHFRYLKWRVSWAL